MDAPAVAHRAAADVAVLDEIVKGLAKSAGVTSLQGLMALDGSHKGSFQDFAGERLQSLCACALAGFQQPKA